MPKEAVQRGVAADGHGIILLVQSIADIYRPTVAELTAATTKRLTYGLLADGFDWQTSIATITTGRYTLQQALELDGVITDTVELKWIFNRVAPTVIETAVGTPGTEGFLVPIYGYPNDHVITAETKLSAVIPFTSSVPRIIPPAANSEMAKIQKLNVSDTVAREHEITVTA